MNKDQELLKIRAIMASIPYLFIVLLIIIWIIVSITEEKIDPLDDSLNKSRQIVADVIVADSTYNGFRVVYATVKAVTPARLSEINSRQHIKDSITHLKSDAPLHFGNMLYTDIFDFLAFATKYHPDPDLVMHNVFVYGREKQHLYIGPHPIIQNPARWINIQTLQGILYIKAEDISRYTSRSEKVYRYWRCRMPFNQSDTDEHFSHFSEDDRLY